MDKATFNQILELNNEFYKLVAEEFSKTRQTDWPGWQNVLNELQTNCCSKLNVLDLACGNGRFYGFLKKNNVACSYFGTDNNQYLLEYAKKTYPEQKFQNFDVIRDVLKLDGRYNLIVAFGITHHIPDKKYREKWFQSLAKLADKKCLIVLTFWDSQKLKSKLMSNENVVRNKSINPVELEEQDFFLGWDKRVDAIRYAHNYTGEEIQNIKKIYENLGFVKFQEFKMDGKNNELNHYLLMLRP